MFGPRSHEDSIRFYIIYIDQFRVDLDQKTALASSSSVSVAGIHFYSSSLYCYTYSYDHIMYLIKVGITFTDFSKKM